MPEIWLNYGASEVVLDIRAENLEQTISSGAVLEGNERAAGAAGGGLTGGKDSADASNHHRHHLEPEEIAGRLGEGLSISKPFDLVLMHDSQSVRQIVSSIFTLCERRSVQFPGILADRAILPSVKAGLPEGSVAGEFNAQSISDGSSSGNSSGTADGRSNNDTSRKRNMVFVAEAEFDGLFGYETVATRLIRRFGADEMLAAYAKRDGGVPSPGRRTGSFEEAVRFADRFEIGGIDIVADADGISDIFVGHPSATAANASASLESHSIMDVEHQKAMIVSTGKASSNATLADSLSSVWNCHAAVRKNGLCILVAECSRGLGSDALRMHIEGRLPPERLQNPSIYVDGMEEILFLYEAQKRCQIALVSILPEMYTGLLNIVSIPSMKRSVEYIQKTQGARQKASVVSDGSRLLLR